MKHKIPNTNLTLTETEIQAVVDYAYSRSMGKVSSKGSNESKKSALVSSYDPDTDGIFELSQDKSIFINYGNHDDQADAEIYTMDVLEDDEFEVPERFKNIINTGNIKKKTGNTKIILKPNEGYCRVDADS